MRTTAWLLPVGLVLAVIGGCSSSRFGLAKADPPANKPKDADQVVYGNPWKRPKKDDPAPSKEMTAEMAKVKKDMEAAKAASSDLTPWLKNAAEAEAKGELAAAKGLYQKILDKDANNAEAHHRLAVIADQQQDASTADEHYLKALTLNRRDADLLSDMGYSLFLRGKLDESERRLKEALEANPYHRGAHSNLGLVYGRQGKYDQALAAFRQSGTEADAQRNIAQLFPNGRPNAAGGQPNETAVADNSRRGAPALPTDVDQRLANAPLSEVMQRMQQEREAAARARALPPNNEFRPELNGVAAPSVANTAPPMNAAGSMNPLTNSQNSTVPAIWPPVAATPPPTFNAFGGANPATQPQPGVAPYEFAAASPVNVAKPQDPNGFWTGNLGSNPPAPTNTMPQPPGYPPNNYPPNNSFAQNMNPGVGTAPTMNNPWGNPASPGMGNDFASPYNGMMVDPHFRPSGMTDPANPNAARSNQGMSEAQRIAAQMAIGTGPGGLLPVVNSGPVAAPLPPNQGNGVNWAYEEMSGNGNQPVENAVWTRPQPQGSDRSPPTNNSAPGSIAPAQPWGSDWTSPGPAPINWQNDASGNPAATPPPWAPGAATNGQSANGSAMTPPAWNGGNPSGAANSNPNANVDTYRWGDASNTGPNNNRPRNDAPANTNGGGNSTTIPNWPYAPSRP